MTMSSIEKYDRAVYTYLSTISPRIIYAPTQNALRTMTKREEFSDKKPWDFISYYRSPTFEIDWNRMNNPAAVTGDRTTLVRDTTTGIRRATYVQNIPINLTYDIDIWASKASEVQDLAISLITKLFMQDQVLEVPLLSDLVDARFHLLDISWTDNSDIEREVDIGRIYRHTISFTLDARLPTTREETTSVLCAAPINLYEYEGDIDNED